MNPDTLVNPPAQQILIYESAQHATFHNVNRNGSPFFTTGPSATPPLCMGTPQNYHAGKSNFLFCDAHVKALTPGTTWSPDQTVFRQFNQTATCTKAMIDAQLATGNYNGGATVEMWNPQSNTVVYP